MSRRAVSMIEVVVLCGIAACLMLPVLQLSGRNVSDPQEQLERQVATSMCLDLIERLKTFSLSRSIPGQPAKTGSPVGALPEKYLYGAERTDRGAGTLFQRAWKQQLDAMGIAFTPAFEVTPDPASPGMFRLDVSVAWVNAKGHARSVKAARWCYAP